ncbi:D-alanyl-D-alanine carboxypeptidase family protein [Croceibacterium ferulae]|uniref:D-alanyl-D-alanine carboxypeptidase family protein n=1 Tax=Croceibacterium ferulae TaxID=1854641 RepID=UPI001F4E81DA|nr:D-alanyl-D-alanine carboxypeptidase family protein [Croceibacterium ferulae]
MVKKLLALGAMVLCGGVALAQANRTPVPAVADTQNPAIVLAPLADTAPVPPELPVAYLVDLSSGQILFERDAGRRFVPASVTKVMTAYSVFKLLGEGALKPEQVVTVPREVAEVWSGEGSSMFLKEGEQVTIDQLLMGTTTVSGNDAAVMLAVTAAGSLPGWLDVMNANAAELGMRDTHYGSPNGYPDEGRTYSSARDLARLAEAMVTRYPQLYSRYIGNHGFTWRGITQANHDPITGRVEGADGIKTGYTRQAGYTFVGSAQRGDRRLVIVLGAVPNIPMRNQVARDLMEWGFSAFDSRQLLPGGAPVGEALVQGGAADSVALQTTAPVLSSMARGTVAETRIEVHYRGPLEAPVKAGQTVAFLRVSAPGQVAHDVPLIAAEDVAEAGLFRRLRNGLVGFVS